MVVTVHAQHMDLTPALKHFAIENLHDPLALVWRKEGAQLEIFLRDLRGTKGGQDQECRAVFHIPNGPKLVITEVTDDMRTSIHQCRKRLMRRARSYIGQKVLGQRRPRKYYIAEVVSTELVRNAPRAEDVPHAQETIR